MPTFKTNKTKRSGELVQASNNPNDYLFASVGKDKDGHKEIRHLDEASNKIIIDNQNILVKCKNGWTKLSVANVKEDEIWNGWNNYFKKATEFKTKVIGFDDKNEQFVSAFDEEKGVLIMALGNEIISIDDASNFSSSEFALNVILLVHHALMYHGRFIKRARLLQVFLTRKITIV